MNLWHLLVLACTAFAVGALLARLRQPKRPPPGPRPLPGRTFESVRRGYRAHAADIWRCAPAEVSPAMENAAKRDLYAADHGATFAMRRGWIANNPGVPSLPDASILWPDVDITKPTTDLPLTAYDVWIEGFITNGEKVPAQLVEAGVLAHSWHAACTEAVRRAGWDVSYLDLHRMTYFGCRFFPNEEAARGTFG